MGEPILNLSSWIDRRRKEVGPYADHIVHSVKAYEDRITALEEENKRLREAYDALHDISSSGGFRHSSEEQDARLQQARAAAVLLLDIWLREGLEAMQKRLRSLSKEEKIDG